MTNRANMRKRFSKMAEEEGTLFSAKNPHKARTKKAQRKRQADARMKERTAANRERG